MIYSNILCVYIYIYIHIYIYVYYVIYTYIDSDPTKDRTVRSHFCRMVLLQLQALPPWLASRVVQCKAEVRHVGDTQPWMVYHGKTVGKQESKNMEVSYGYPMASSSFSDFPL